MFVRQQREKNDRQEPVPVIVIITILHCNPHSIAFAAYTTYVSKAEGIYLLVDSPTMKKQHPPDDWSFLLARHDSRGFRRSYYFHLQGRRVK
jgi:hypothetical protein